MNNSIFHETSEGISSHKHNMKGYSLVFFFLCHRGSVGNLQSKVPPPHLTPPSSFDSPICLAWSSLFIWLLAAVQFIYSVDSKVAPRLCSEVLACSSE